MTINEKLRAEWAEHGENAAPSWDAVVNLMDDDIREYIHQSDAPVTQRRFWAQYCVYDGGQLGEVTQW